ncbi:unnamed protein product [Ectocarpus sp. 8 AP-2014]
MDDLCGRGQLPAFTAGPQRVWGLTAAITDGVLRNGIVPSSSSSSSSVGDDNHVPGDRDGVDKEGPRRSSL